MRIGITIFGIILLALSLLVLANGTAKLGALNACISSNVCPNSMVTSSDDFQLSVFAAKNQIVYGAVFGIIAGLILLFGVFGRSRRGTSYVV